MTCHGMFARTLLFFLNDNEAIVLFVKFQITTPIPFQNDATYMLGYLYAKKI